MALERVGGILLQQTSNYSDKVDIERLLTRLDTPMPYDTQLTKNGLELVKARVIQVLTHRLDALQMDAQTAPILDRFGERCLERGVTFISFNYDTTFEAALYRLKRGWYPHIGYGFWCRPPWENGLAALSIRDDSFRTPYSSYTALSTGTRSAVTRDRTP